MRKARHRPTPGGHGRRSAAKPRRGGPAGDRRCAAHRRRQHPHTARRTLRHRAEDPMKVAGRVAIVTGGGGGIGGALAEELAAHGARVVVADLDGARAQAVADKINAATPGSAVAAGADVSTTTAIRDLIALAERQFGPVDL